MLKFYWLKENQMKTNVKIKHNCKVKREVSKISFEKAKLIVLGLDQRQSSGKTQVAIAK